jgi:hypothetical protein
MRIVFAIAIMLSVLSSATADLTTTGVSDTSSGAAPSCTTDGSLDLSHCSNSLYLALVI